MISCSPWPSGTCWPSSRVSLDCKVPSCWVFVNVVNGIVDVSSTAMDTVRPGEREFCWFHAQKLCSERLIVLLNRSPKWGRYVLIVIVCWSVVLSITRSLFWVFYNRLKEQERSKWPSVWSVHELWTLCFSVRILLGNRDDVPFVFVILCRDELPLTLSLIQKHLSDAS